MSLQEELIAAEVAFKSAMENFKTWKQLWISAGMPESGDLYLFYMEQLAAAARLSNACMELEKQIKASSEPGKS